MVEIKLCSSKLFKYPANDKHVATANLYTVYRSVINNLKSGKFPTNAKQLHYFIKGLNYRQEGLEKE